MPLPNVPGRAYTPEEKRAVVETLLRAWEAKPELRLGQLIENARGDLTLFYVEDQALANILRAYGDAKLGK
jgi:hypothetical protein